MTAAALATPAAPAAPAARARVLLALAEGRDPVPLVTAVAAGGAEPSGVVTAADALIAAAPREAPDVVLLDLEFDSQPAAIISTLLERAPAMRIVGVYTGQPSTLLCRVLIAGAIGFVALDADPRELAAVIAEARAGRAALAAGVVDDVLRGVREQLRHHDDQQRRRALLVERLRRRFETPGALRAVFQPIEDLQARRRLGFLALTRFAGEPEAGTGRRFAEARSVGLARELEIAAAREALRHAPLLPDGELLFVKVAGDTVASGRLDVVVAEEAAARVVLELSDHAAVRDRDAFHDALETLRDRGVRYSVDETGAGFGSLDHVLDVAPSFVRLAGGLTRDIDSDRTRRALALTVTSFATHLGARVIADVIETEDELRALRRLGVQYGLGYHIGRPGPLPASIGSGEDEEDDDDAAGSETRIQWAHDGATHIVLPPRARRAFEDAARLSLRALTDALPGWAAYVAHVDREHGQLRVVRSSAAELPALETGLAMPLADSLDGQVLAGRLRQVLHSSPDCEMARRLCIRGAVTVPFAGTPERPLATVSAVTRTSGALAADALELVRDAGAAMAEALNAEHGGAEERVAQALRELAWRDGLSGLFNGQRFNELLEEANARATAGEGTWLTVFKLCNFRTLGERHGQALAELVLKDVARALASLAQPVDTLARVGPTTYACLLYGRRVTEVDFLRHAIDDHVAARARARRAHAELRSACEPLGGTSATDAWDAAIERLFTAQ